MPAPKSFPVLCTLLVLLLLLLLLLLQCLQVIQLLEKPRDPALKYVFVDTPGQIEIFTWSASGQLITGEQRSPGSCRTHPVHQVQ